MSTSSLVVDAATSYTTMLSLPTVRNVDVVAFNGPNAMRFHLLCTDGGSFFGGRRETT